MAWNASAFVKAALAKRAVSDPAFARLDEANRLFLKRRCEEAATVCLEISQSSPPHAGVLTNLAYALTALGRKEDAAKALQTAVACCANFAPAANASLVSSRS